TFKDWSEREAAERERVRAGGQPADPATPRAGLRQLRARYFDARPALAEHTERLRDAGRTPQRAATHTARLHALHQDILTALCYRPKPEPVEMLVDPGERRVPVRVALHEPTLAAVECGWAPDTDAALDPDGA